MPDFNIKFKYEGAGKAAANARTKAISASKSAAKGASQNQSQRPVEQNRELVSSLKTLTSSIKSLERTIKSSGGVRPGGGGGGGQPSFGGTGGSFGKIGASLGIAGAGIGLVGFAIQKINQIGTAYIDLASRQAGTVGVSGDMRTNRYKNEQGGWSTYNNLGISTGRRGIYLQTEQGAMTKAHRMAAGRFSGGVSDRAVQVGSIFGMGAEEIGRISGTYSRAGGNLDRAMSVARGSGIETELPMFMQGMAGVLEEAVTSGVNASNLADDLGDQVAMITQRTGTNSVGMAMNILKSFKGVQQQVGRGQIGGYAQFATYRAAGQTINRRLSNPQQAEAYLTDLRERGILDINEITAARARAASAGRSLQLEDLEAQSPTIRPILQRMEAERGGADLNAATVNVIRRDLGGGAAGARRAMAINAVPGDTIRGQAAALQGMVQPVAAGTEQRGTQQIEQRFNLMEKSAATMGIARRGDRESLTMRYGARFADTALTIEKSLIKLAEQFSPSAEAIQKVGEAAKATAEALVGIKKWFDENFTPNAPQENRSWLTASPAELGRRIRNLLE
jgi:hypothetical protein